MQKKYKIYLSSPHMCGEELKFVQAAFDSNWIAPTGPDITAFESEMAQYLNCSHAVALSSGTAAIHLALILSGISSGDEVLCSTFTFIGTANPILYQGATPVFIDSEYTTWNMDPNLLEYAIKERIKIGKKPKACIIVHLYGNSAHLNSLLEICNKYEILCIEDAAESLGTLYDNKHTGTFASLGVYSFNGNKIITTSGGGMLIGKNSHDIEKARFLSTQARDKAIHYEHTTVGYNYRMSNICAAIGRGQLTSLKSKIEKKEYIYNYYKNAFKEIPEISLIPQPGFSRSNHWLTCICIKSNIITRDTIYQNLENINIETRPLWKPMHLQPVFRNHPRYCSGVSEELFTTGLCLPSSTNITDEDLQYITSVIQKLFKN